MLISKKNRHAIYETLFKEGVMIAKKDYYESKHPDLPSVPNLQVIKTMQSLKSKDYVKEQFAWRHYYWYLTNEGISFLRDYLHLPSEIIPATLKRPTRSEAIRPRIAAVRPDTTRMEEDRAMYRRNVPDKKADAGPGAEDVVFKGYGRGSRGGGGGPPSNYY